LIRYRNVCITKDRKIFWYRCIVRWKIEEWSYRESDRMSVLHPCGIFGTGFEKRRV